ncbi:MAG: hypothetical protein WCP06_00565 [Verrucomicrobiota bacterium]
MHHSFLQKLVLVIFVAFLTAGLYEFYDKIIKGADVALNGKPGTALTTPRPTPRRY